MRIFVSSTFRDFQLERDVLRNHVEPRLNALGKQHGLDYSFTDLRWGVDTLGLTEEESNRRVLSVCLEEIDRAGGMMLVMIGDRYGYRPGSERIRDAIAVHEARTGISFAADITDPDISVTELEILYGALSDPDKLSSTLFYFRETPEGSGEETLGDDEKRISDLKNRIMAAAPDRVRRYQAQEPGDLTADGGFADLVYRDLEEMVNAHKARLDAAIKEAADGSGISGDVYDAARYVAEQLKQEKRYREIRRTLADARSFDAGRFAGLLDKRMPSRMDDDLTAAILMHAPAGAGKSATAAAVAAVMERQGYETVPVYCDLSDELKQADGIMDYVRLTLQEKGDGRLFFLVDGLEQLDKAGAIRVFRFLDQTGDGDHRCLAVADDTAGLHLYFKRSRALQPLQLTEAERILESLQGRIGRRLSGPVREALLEKCFAEQDELPANPKWLYYALSCLCLMNADDFSEIAGMGDDMEAISSYQLREIGQLPRDPDQMAVRLIDRICESISDTARHAVDLIALSREGLTGPELQQILKNYSEELTPLELTRLINYTPGLFCERGDGRIDLAESPHGHVRRGLRKKIANTPEEKVFRKLMADHYTALLKEDPRHDRRFAELLQILIASGRFSAIPEIPGALQDDLTAVLLTDWLFDFKDPEEAGYLEQPGLWRSGIERSAGTVDPVPEATYAAIRRESMERDSAIRLSALPESPAHRAEQVIKGFALWCTMLAGDGKLSEFTSFIKHHFIPAYRVHRYEGYEYPVRMMCAILLKCFTFPEIGRGMASGQIREADPAQLMLPCIRLLFSTGFVKDRLTAMQFVSHSLGFDSAQICDAIMKTDPYLAGDADGSRMELTLTLLGMTYEYATHVRHGDLNGGTARELLNVCVLASYAVFKHMDDYLALDARSFNRDDIVTLVLTINAGYGMTLAEDGDPANAEEVFFSGIRSSIPEIDTDDLPVEDADMSLETRMQWFDRMDRIAWLYLALARFYMRFTDARDPEEKSRISNFVLSAAGRSLKISRKAEELIGDTVYAAHRSAEALLCLLESLCGVDDEACQVLADEAWKRLNKYRMQTGSHHSLLDLAELMDVLMRCSYLEGLEAMIQKQSYTARREALLRKVDAYDPAD